MMLKLKRKKNMIRFSGRKHSRLGILSSITGMAAVIGFIAVSVVSGTMHGEGGLIFGFIGFFLFALSVFGFVLSYKAMKERDIFYRFPIIGAVLNGIMMIVFFVLYIIGFAV